jgi:1-acyl-sn-glycerol-3-phosphate acyltransferase
MIDLLGPFARSLPTDTTRLSLVVSPFLRSLNECRRTYYLTLKRFHSENPIARCCAVLCCAGGVGSGGAFCGVALAAAGRAVVLLDRRRRRGRGGNLSSSRRADDGRSTTIDPKRFGETADFRHDTTNALCPKFHHPTMESYVVRMKSSDSRRKLCFRSWVIDDSRRFLSNFKVTISSEFENLIVDDARCDLWRLGRHANSGNDDDGWAFAVATAAGTKRPIDSTECLFSCEIRGIPPPRAAGKQTKGTSGNGRRKPGRRPLFVGATFEASIMVTITPPKHPDIGSIDLPPVGPSSNRWVRQQQILWGFVAFQLTGTVVVGILISVVVMVWHHPLTFGLGVVVPYYYFCFFVSAGGGTRRRRRPGLRPELDHGAPWRRFSANFSALQWMRQFLQLSMQDGTNRSSSDSSSSNKNSGPIFASTEQQYIFAVFPRGINGEFRLLMDGMLQDAVMPPERADHTRTLAASILFKIPLVREIVLWTGCVDATAASVADRLLRDNFNLIVLPGGQQEQIRTQWGEEQAYVMRRKGFLKLALRHQVPVVPAYVFGSVDAYRTLRMSQWGWKVRHFLLQNVGVALPPLYWGYKGSICCPNPVKTTVVFGSPLYLHDAIRPGTAVIAAAHPGANDAAPMTTMETDGSNSAGRKDPSSPTTAAAAAANNDDVNEAHVDAAHAVFVEALVKLFDENKARLGYGDRTLRVL